MQRTDQIDTILQCWGIDDIAEWQTIQANIAKVTLTDGRKFALKDLGPSSADATGRLHFEYDVLRHVEQSDVTVAVPKLSTQHVPYVLDSDNLYRLSHWLPNQPTTPQHDEERERLYRNYGTAIAHLHHSLATVEDSVIQQRTWETTLKQRVLGEAVPVCLNNLNQGQRTAFEELLSEIQPGMPAAYENLPIQLIIWDCQPGNVAVDGFDVSGFIDCDHISLAPRIFDLADFLVHLVKWDIGDAEKTARRLAGFPHLMAGYSEVVPLSSQEQAALPYAMAGIPLIFMDFFFQNSLLEAVQLELDTFEWLVRHRSEIAAKLEVA